MPAGDVIAGTYRLEALLGMGGFGEVYRASDLRLGREVAVKLLHTDTRDSTAKVRFRREAELARRLQHPNTVRLYDFGEYDDTHFIVYELLVGKPLSAELAQGPISEERCAHMTAQILKSLAEAHAAGVVHRDIKPANLFVTGYAGEPDFIKVLDFGIAKQLLEGTALTATDVVVGSPRYMAPEQAAGLPVGPACDLYAVGLVMVEMLTGSPLVTERGNIAMLRLVSPDNEPLPPEVTSSRLAQVIRRATEKSPARRFESAEEMLNHLRAAMEAPEATLVPETRYSPLESVARPAGPAVSRRGAVFVALAIAFGVLGLSGLVVLAVTMTAVDALPERPAPGRTGNVIGQGNLPEVETVGARLESWGCQDLRIAPSSTRSIVTCRKGDQDVEVIVDRAATRERAEGYAQHSEVALEASRQRAIAARVFTSAGTDWTRSDELLHVVAEPALDHD